MTLENLLQTPLMKDAEVIAGAAGLTRDVTWCVPDTALQFDNWIMPGLLLLYTGKAKELTFRDYVTAILKDRPSGVLLFGGKMATYIEESDLAFCSERTLPLIRMPDASNPLRFSKRFASVVGKKFDEERRMEEWLRALCYSGIGISGETAGKLMGYQPDNSYCCFLLKNRHAGQKDPIQVEIEIGFACDFFSKEFFFRTDILLHFIEEDVAVCFVPIRPTENVKLVHERLAQTLARLQALTGDIKWCASVGTAAHTLAEFQTSFRNAKKTEEVIAALNVHEKVSFYDNWYLHMLLLNEPKSTLREHMKHTLDPILDNPELVDTLSNYLTFGENLKITAEKMFIHVNTLKYRIGKICELLDCDLKDPNVRFRIRMAITIERYLRYSEGERPLARST